MGTGFDMSILDEELGIIPRAVGHLFKGVEQRRQAAADQGRPVPEFKISAQFLEVQCLWMMPHEFILMILLFDRYSSPTTIGQKKSPNSFHWLSQKWVCLAAQTNRTVYDFHEDIFKAVLFLLTIKNSFWYLKKKKKKICKI